MVSVTGALNLILSIFSVYSISKHDFQYTIENDHLFVLLLFDGVFIVMVDGWMLLLHCWADELFSIVWKSETDFDLRCVFARHNDARWNGLYAYGKGNLGEWKKVMEDSWFGKGAWEDELLEWKY